MKTINFIFIILLLTAGLTIFTGCIKDPNTQNTSTDMTADMSSILAEKTFNYIGNYPVSASSDIKI